jgi:hypothetical protein
MKRRSESSGRSVGLPPSVTPSMPTAFEMRVSELSLTAPTYSESPELRHWCKVNRNKCYIPEWLLKEWGITVIADAS